MNDRNDRKQPEHLIVVPWQYRRKTNAKCLLGCHVSFPRHLVVWKRIPPWCCGGLITNRYYTPIPCFFSAQLTLQHMLPEHQRHVSLSFEHWNITSNTLQNVSTTDSWHPRHSGCAAGHSPTSVFVCFNKLGDYKQQLSNGRSTCSIQISDHLSNWNSNGGHKEHNWPSWDLYPKSLGWKSDIFPTIRPVTLM